MGKIIRNGIEFSSTVDTANNISYDNSLSGLEATTTQKAIDEVCDNVSTLNESLEQINNEITLSNQIHHIGFEKTSVDSIFVISIYMDEVGNSRYQIMFNSNGITTRYTTNGGSSWTTIFTK